MYMQLRNILEKNTIWHTSRVAFVDFKENQEIEFCKNNDNYTITVIEKIFSNFEKKTYSLDKNSFYEKLKTMIENTVFNPENYKFNKYNKYGTLVSLWFNQDYA